MVELTIVYRCLVQDDFAETALMAAVNKGHLHVAEILVKNGADVNYRNKVRALIPVTQVLCMWPMIRHGIMVKQWEVQGMNNKYALCAGHSRHAYVVVPPFDTNKILSSSQCPSHTDFLVNFVRAVFTFASIVREWSLFSSLALPTAHIQSLSTSISLYNSLLHMLQKGQSVFWGASFEGHTEIVLLLLRHQAAVDLPNDVRYSRH